jgi:hypothetical protein
MAELVACGLFLLGHFPCWHSALFGPLRFGTVLEQSQTAMGQDLINGLNNGIYGGALVVVFGGTVAAAG